jgi:hypothetical protein
MHLDGVKLLKLMFNPGEMICASPNQFGYHSLPLEEITGEAEVTLKPTPESVEKRNEWLTERHRPTVTWEQCFETCHTNDLLLVALSPVNGFRTDANAYAYRSFMVEMDQGTGTKEDLQAQANYINDHDLPFSACIFSGGKSLHYLITLDEDCASEAEWRYTAEWILAALPMADQMTKNPTRSIRIPGAFRKEKQKHQKLLKLNGRIPKDRLMAWLARFPGAEPKKEEIRHRSDRESLHSIRPWIITLLRKGLDPSKSRNGQWFMIAFEFALAGYSEFDTIELLGEYFSPENSGNKKFSRKEWQTTIKSAFKHVADNRE